MDPLIPGKTRVEFRIDGYVVIPESKEVEPLLAQWAASPPERQRAEAARFVRFLEGEPVAVAVGAVPIQKLLVAVLCSLGGNRLGGKAPRGGLAYRHHRALAPQG